MIEKRVERHIIHENSPHFKVIDHFCLMSKNLYNQANYIVRQEFIKNGKWIRYNNLEKLCKNQVEEFNDYRKLPGNTSQQILMLLDKNWKSFFESMKSWKKNPDKFLGKPQLPKYKKKDARNLLVFTYNQAILQDGIIKFPKLLNKMTIKTRVEKLQQVRIIPNYHHFIIEVVYNKEIEEKNQISQRICSIDYGLNNLITMTNNCKLPAIIINGKGLKSINQYWNKQLSHYKSVETLMNPIFAVKKDGTLSKYCKITRRMSRLNLKRNNKVLDYLHKASKFVIDYCKKHKIDTLIIGHNENLKQEINLGDKNNQNFYNVPFFNLIDQLRYKCQENHIQFFVTEESYTSQSSFFDDDILPIYDEQNHQKYQFSGKRIKRGLYKRHNGKLLNADVNGSLNIMKKVFSDVKQQFDQEIEDLLLNPLKVVVS